MFKVKQFIKFNHETTGDAYLDIEEGKEFHNKNVEKYIDEYLCQKNLKISQLKELCNKKIRDELIKQLIA